MLLSHLAWIRLQDPRLTPLERTLPASLAAGHALHENVLALRAAVYLVGDVNGDLLVGVRGAVGFYARGRPSRAWARGAPFQPTAASSHSDCSSSRSLPISSKDDGASHQLHLGSQGSITYALDRVLKMCAVIALQGPSIDLFERTPIWQQS
jgi:hypothetical protein